MDDKVFNARTAWQAACDRATAAMHKVKGPKPQIDIAREEWFKLRNEEIVAKRAYMSAMAKQNFKHGSK